MHCASSFLTGGAEHDEQESSLAATPGSSSLRVDEDVSFTFKQEAVGGLGDVQVIGLGTGTWNMSLFLYHIIRSKVSIPSLLVSFQDKEDTVPEQEVGEQAVNQLQQTTSPGPDPKELGCHLCPQPRRFPGGQELLQHLAIFHFR